MATEKRGPIQQRIDLDGCNWSCPCGSSTYTSDGLSWEVDQLRLKSWMREHAKHSDGTIRDYHSPDGLRCCADPGPRVRSIPAYMLEEAS